MVEDDRPPNDPIVSVMACCCLVWTQKVVKAVPLAWCDMLAVLTAAEMIADFQICLLIK